MKKPLLPFLRVIAIVAAAGLAQSCASTDTATTGAGKESPAKNEFYTAANIWYKHPREIRSVNHHRGAILPVGTKVTIEDVSRRAIAFLDQKGTKYRLVLVRKYTGPGFTVQDLFRQYFTETDPLGKDGAFSRLTEQEKNAVRTGRIAQGMSKEAVLMAYGYPPSHMTPSTDGDVWKYWTHKFRAYLVFFSNSKVVEIREVF